MMPAGYGQPVVHAGHVAVLSAGDGVQRSGQLADEAVHVGVEAAVWPVRCVQVEPAGLAEFSRVWADGGSVVALERESERDVCVAVLAAGLRDAHEQRLAAA
jgi:hypothetical protein